MSRARRNLGDDIDTFFEHGVHLPTRTIYCGNEVGTDGTEAEFFLKGMSLLSATEDPIRVLLHNWGGDEYGGLAMYDAIATSRAHVTAIVYGAAFSMGSWILQAADHRVVSPNATLLLHFGDWGHTVEVASPARLNALRLEGDRIRSLMEDCYLSRLRAKTPNFSRSRLRQALAAEWYLSATEAVSLGLADEVLSQ